MRSERGPEQRERRSLEPRGETYSDQGPLDIRVKKQEHPVDPVIPITMTDEKDVHDPKAEMQEEKQVCMKK